ncbi:DUF2867 domain-containing protein [Rhizobium sp. 18055]|uniref:DUF2867 domain-containing protein n=1 Tax=Rhizobium sp. 18055 TaxID=2681403 RepID=UPI001359AD92|nr:DUF2867 domain-containing protein [Rhizobium sp. 18055]
MLWMPARPLKIAPCLPHSALPQADWADCYQLSVPAESLTAIKAARLMLGYAPFWITGLMRLRNLIVGPLLGLKTAAHDLPEGLEKIGIFPLLSQSARQVIVGFDDRHLDFRVVIDVEDAGDVKRVSATTLVRRKILIGRIYIAVITPFHNLVVVAMMAHMGKRLKALSSPPSA